MENIQGIQNFEYLHCGLKFRPSPKSLQILAKSSMENGILIHQKQPKIILKDSILHDKLTENHLLISTARPLLNKAFYYFSNKTNLLLLTDAKGYIIDLISSPEILLSCFNKGIMLGSCMDYPSFGTNSISMSKHEEYPIALLGSEHFCTTLQSFNSIAAPLKIDSKIVGFLNITTIEPNDLTPLSSLVMLLTDLIQFQLYYRLKCNNDKNTLECNNLNHKEGKIYFFGSILVNSNFLFTLKETEILYELYINKSPHKIPTKLYISSNTFKTHLKHIYQKLNVSSVYECLAKISLLLNAGLPGDNSPA